MTSFEVEDCIECGVRFGVPVGYSARRRADKKSFYCPNGHSMAYVESEADRLRRERDLLKQRLAQKDDAIAAERRMREAADRQSAARKGQITKLRNRAAAGVCPCCNRTVSQMAKHMATKHPGFKAEEVA